MTLWKSPESMLNLLHFERREIALDFGMLERCRYRMIQRWCGCIDQFCLGSTEGGCLSRTAWLRTVLIAPHCQIGSKLCNLAIGATHWDCSDCSDFSSEVKRILKHSARIWRANESTYISKFSVTASSKWLPISTHYFHVEKRSNNRWVSPHGIKEKVIEASIEAICS